MRGMNHHNSGGVKPNDQDGTKENKQQNHKGKHRFNGCLPSVAAMWRTRHGILLIIADAARILQSINRISCFNFFTAESVNNA